MNKYVDAILIQEFAPDRYERRPAPLPAHQLPVPGQRCARGDQPITAYGGGQVPREGGEHKVLAERKLDQHYQEARGLSVCVRGGT
ncbi:hypothetical protein GCM10009548_52670 [Streptomyces malaysiensis subsp. malaysiensis]